MGEFLNIIIRTLDSQELLLSITSLARVTEIKYFINLRVGIPIHRQRLIFQGYLLKDEESLEEVGITNNETIYLVGNVQRDEDPLLALAQLSLLNNLRSLRRPRIPRRVLSNDQISEVLRQNLYVIDDLIRHYNNEQGENRRVFREGQWVDVLDTVNQWLDAQVLQLRTTRSGTRVLVHYNGWPDRWDEWINADSPRIMPFRSKTRQASGLGIQSPVPSSPPVIRKTGNENISTMTLQTSIYVDIVKNFMEKYSVIKQSLNTFQQIGQFFNVQNISEQQEQLKNELDNLKIHIAPVIDRVGRAMTDLGQALSRDSNEEMNLIEASDDPSPMNLY